MQQQALYNHQNMFANMPTSPNISYSSKPNGPPIEDLFDTIKSNDPSLTKSAFQDSFLGYGNNNSIMHNSFANNLNTSVNNQSLTTPWQDGCQEQDEYWVTVFGFPPNAANTVLARFSNCGAILGKKKLTLQYLVTEYHDVLLLYFCNIFLIIFDYLCYYYGYNDQIQR